MTKKISYDNFDKIGMTKRLRVALKRKIPTTRKGTLVS